jgi:hypothetical protein
MLRICAVTLLCFSLTGCAQYQARLQAQQAAQRQALDDADDAQCRQYGATPGSDAYVGCRMNIANNRQVADDAFRQQSLQNFANAAAQIGARPPTPQPATDDHVCIAANNTYYRC